MMKYLVYLAILIGMVVVPCAADFPWCAQQDLFFWDAPSDISGYKVIDHIPQLAAQSSITTPAFTASSGEITLGTWATPSGKPGTELAPGLWRFRSYVYTSSTSGTTSLRFYAINRSAFGVETPLFFGNAITRDIDATGVPQEYLTSYARRNSTTIFPGDRLLIRVNVSTDSASARTLTYEMAGNTNASMVSIGYFLCQDSDAILGSSGGGSGGVTTAMAFAAIGVSALGLFVAVYAFRKRKR
jgi:hypothetical protein